MANSDLDDFDLQQIDAEYVNSLPKNIMKQLILVLVNALRKALDQLNQNSTNSSRPPSSEPPWLKSVADSGGTEEGEGIEDNKNTNTETEAEAGDVPKKVEQEESPNSKEKRGKPGRQKGMKGYGRELTLPVTDEKIHHPEHCHMCNTPLEPTTAVAWTAFYVLDFVRNIGELLGIQLTHTKHVYTKIQCSCGHVNRAEPGRCNDDDGWKVPLTEYHLAGPMLVTLIACLTQRLRASRRLTQEFLQDWFGVHMSTSTINQCIHEAGRAVAPVEDQLAAEINEANLLHVDETTWKESTLLLWLWVFCSSSVTLYLVGYRSKEIIQNLLGSDFAGWLMSDGYRVYREYLHRLRCWAHLVRKAQGLVESLNVTHAQPFGNAALQLLEELMSAVYKAREGPGTPSNLQPVYAQQLGRFKALCESYRDSPHEKTRALAREFLYDWDVIWVVIQFPWLPLTNNEAERALRHWVIARRISQGTRTEEGTRVFALLASVIETCRKRGISPWSYIVDVVEQRRKGNPAPLLPASA